MSSESPRSSGGGGAKEFNKAAKSGDPRQKSPVPPRRGTRLQGCWGQRGGGIGACRLTQIPTVTGQVRGQK